MFQLISVLAALAGVALAAYAWLAEGTGVTGTPGALLALVGAVAVWIAAMVMGLPSVRGGLHMTLRVLAVLAGALTALAAWFLMQNVLAAVMAVASLALLFAVSSGRRTAAW